jgi:UDP-GlcNAc:undecaprenyl-phosphate GlcNAc-1-phosphate transferase
MNLANANYMLMFTVIVMPLLLLTSRKIARKINLVDIPNSRKIHSEAIPLTGGITLFIMTVVLMVMSETLSSFHLYLVVASGLVVLVGLLDDVFQLSAMWRFIIQISASLVVIYFTQVKLDSFGYLLYPDWYIDLGVLTVPVTLFGVVGVINALNMSDGIDGLAAMTFFLPVAVLVLLAGSNDLTLWLMMLLICISIFVIFNISDKYKVFLGDNGSMFLGFVLAWLLVYFSQEPQAVTSVTLIKPVTALYLVALPIIDTIFVMIRRIKQGISPFKPDKSHLHHLFLAHGFSQPKTLLMVIILQSSLILLGIVMLHSGITEYTQFYTFVLLSIVYYFLMQRNWKTFKHLI